MRPITHNIAYENTLSLSSTLFRTRSSLRTTHLLSLGKCHASTTSGNDGEEALRQARAKQWYEHLHTRFHTINGYTSPTFKILLADIARRAGHTVSEGDGVANPRWDWTENHPLLKGEAAGVAKSAGNSVNDDDGVLETRRDWFENNPVLKGEAGDGKGVVEEDNIHDNEWEVEGEDGKATDDEGVTENQLDRYLEDLEEELKALLEQVRMLKRGEEIVSTGRTTSKSLGGSCGTPIPKSCVLNRLKNLLTTG